MFSCLYNLIQLSFVIKVSFSYFNLDLLGFVPLVWHSDTFCVSVIGRFLETILVAMVSWYLT